MTCAAATDSPTLHGAAREIAAGAPMSLLPTGKIQKASKLVKAAGKIAAKIPKASRAGVRTRASMVRGSSCARRGHSFDAATLVTLADGSEVPIDSLAVGDLVLAWDEPSGETAAYPISAVWVHDDPVTGLLSGTLASWQSGTTFRTICTYSGSRMMVTMISSPT